MQLADNADPDQPAHSRNVILGLCCPLTEPMDVVYVDEQRLSRSDCNDAHILWTFAVCIWHTSFFPTLHTIYEGHSIYSDTY